MGSNGLFQSIHAIVESEKQNSELKETSQTNKKILDKFHDILMEYPRRCVGNSDLYFEHYLTKELYFKTIHEVIEENFAKMIERERQFYEKYYVFYHSSNSTMLLYEIQGLLLEFKDILACDSPESILSSIQKMQLQYHDLLWSSPLPIVFRLNQQPFSDEIEKSSLLVQNHSFPADIGANIIRDGERGHDGLDRFRNVFISANCSLTGGYEAVVSNSSHQGYQDASQLCLFNKGLYISNVKPKRFMPQLGIRTEDKGDVTAVITNLLLDAFKHLPEYTELVIDIMHMLYDEGFTGMGRYAFTTQIFIEKNRFQDYGYLSLPFGHPVDVYKRPFSKNIIDPALFARDVSSHKINEFFMNHRITQFCI